MQQQPVSVVYVLSNVEVLDYSGEPYSTLSSATIMPLQFRTRSRNFSSAFFAGELSVGDAVKYKLCNSDEGVLFGFVTGMRGEGAQVRVKIVSLIGGEVPHELVLVPSVEHIVPQSCILEKQYVVERIVYESTFVAPRARPTLLPKEDVYFVERGATIADNGVVSYYNLRAPLPNTLVQPCGPEAPSMYAHNEWVAMQVSL